MAGILVTLLLFLIGLALALGGFLFFRTGLYLLGFLLGASVGLAAFTSGSVPGDWELAVLVVAPVVGIALAVVVRLLLVTSVGAILGAVVVSVLADVPIVPTTGIGDVEPLVVAGIVVGVVAAYFLETAIIVLVSASWGSSMVALAAGASAAGVVEDPAVLLEGYLVVRGIVFLAGVAAQSWLWYYLRQNLDDDQDPRVFLIRRARELAGSAASSAGGPGTPQGRGRPRQDAAAGGRGSTPDDGQRARGDEPGHRGGGRGVEGATGQQPRDSRGNPQHRGQPQGGGRGQPRDDGQPPRGGQSQPRDDGQPPHGGQGQPPADDQPPGGERDRRRDEGTAEESDDETGRGG